MKTLVAVTLSALVLAGCTAGSGSGDPVAPRAGNSPTAGNSPSAWDPNPVPAKRWEECMHQYGELSQDIITSFRGELPDRAQDWPFEITESARLRGLGKISQATSLACGVVAEQQEWLSAGS